MKTQSKWKSAVLWSSLGVQIVIILQILGVWEKLGITSDIANNGWAAVLQALVTLGIFNNPNDAEKF